MTIQWQAMGHAGVSQSGPCNQLSDTWPFLALLDLSAAFDTIDHSILLQRRHHDVGIQGTTLKWFLSYPTDHTLSVSTATPPILFGVLQGSVLGRVVVFVLYTASLSTVTEMHSVLHHSYADDSELQKSSAPHQTPDLLLPMQKCTDGVKIWIKVNKFKLNDDKAVTEAMIIYCGRKSKSLSSSFPDSMTVTLCPQDTPVQ